MSVTWPRCTCARSNAPKPRVAATWPPPVRWPSWTWAGPSRPPTPPAAFQRARRQKPSSGCCRSSMPPSSRSCPSLATWNACPMPVRSRKWGWSSSRRKPRSSPRPTGWSSTAGSGPDDCSSFAFGFSSQVPSDEWSKTIEERYQAATPPRDGLCTPSRGCIRPATAHEASNPTPAITKIPGKGATQRTSQAAPGVRIDETSRKLE